MFNPNPRIAIVPISPRHACYVIDDALLEPERWIDFAAAHAHAFAEESHNAYPGPELRMPDAVSDAFRGYFDQHLRAHMGARRTLRMYSRLSIVTRPPHTLHPQQWLCHVDRLETAPDQCLAATVLYLFHDASLGGTSFYVPRKPQSEILRLLRDAKTQAPEEFATTHGLRPGYMRESNDWFEHAVTVPARFNRLVLYNGGVFHCGDIASPDKLTADPRRGRLTFNGFFVCRRALTA